MKTHSKPIDTIVIHHSATRVLPLNDAYEAFRRSHMEKGWGDFTGYHYIVHPDPSEGWRVARDARFRGAHVGGMNNGKVGVCLIGDYGDRTADEGEWCDCLSCEFGIGECPREPEYGIACDLPFWFWQAIQQIRRHLRWRHNVTQGIRLANPVFRTHSELMPGHTDCGKGVIQRLVNELNVAKDAGVLL